MGSLVSNRAVSRSVADWDGWSRPILRRRVDWARIDMSCRQAIQLLRVQPEAGLKMLSVPPKPQGWLPYVIADRAEREWRQLIGFIRAAVHLPRLRKLLGATEGRIGGYSLSGLTYYWRVDPGTLWKRNPSPQYWDCWAGMVMARAARLLAAWDCYPSWYTLGSIVGDRYASLSAEQVISTLCGHCLKAKLGDDAPFGADAETMEAWFRDDA